MGVWASVITGIISTGIKLFASSQSPDYPDPPKMRKINIDQTRDSMESYEKRRMQAGIDAWKAKFPLLYQGGQHEIEDIGKNQQGILSPQVSGALRSMNLGRVKEGDQYAQSVDLGLNPITLAQRNSQAVNRQIALNPEWSSKISGGTLATMIANNYQNQNAFSQFLGATNMAKWQANQAAGGYNTQALTSGILGTAAAGTQAYLNMQQQANNPINNPLNPTSYRDSSNSYYGLSNYGTTPISQAPAPQSPYPYGNTWFGMYSPQMLGAVPTPQPPPSGGAQSATTNYNTYF